MSRSFQIAIVTTVAIFLSGCASVLVRQDTRPSRELIYGATRFDAAALWEAGMRGQPMFTTANPADRMQPLLRIAVSVGSLLDLPFSLASDAVFLPFDLLVGEKEEWRSPGESP